MWKVVKYHDSVHVMPIDDLIEHQQEDCECFPVYEDGVYVHNSKDGRINRAIAEVLDGMDKQTECLH